MKMELRIGEIDLSIRFLLTCMHRHQIRCEEFFVSVANK